MARTARPTTVGSLPKWRCQKPWLITIAVGRGPASSLAASQRPAAGGVPTVGKNDDDTAATSACAGSALSTSCRSQFTEPDHGELLEGPRAGAPVLHLAVGDFDDRQGAPVVTLPDHRDPLLVGQRQGPQQHGVDDREDRHDRADGDGEQADGEQGGAPVAAERAQGVADRLGQHAQRLAADEALQRLDAERELAQRQRALAAEAALRAAASRFSGACTPGRR